MKIRKLVTWLFAITGGVILLLFLITTGLYLSADMKKPDLPDTPSLGYEVILTDSLRQYGPNRLYLSPSGLWELNVEGDAFERGFALGSMATDLLKYQEEVFVNQIREFIPSDSYLSFLRFLLILFNRNLGEYVNQEYREEIYGISLFCTNEYNAIGTPYERQLNYHAAHDIGHAMQDYMLVGCTSFGVWGKESEDSTLLIGRNFDFYVGDDFARNKMVSFYTPSTGYRFVSVGWPGMIGVLSGMNETGLTVTINAAKSTIPTSAATPISLLAREILQYASTIEEAYRIAERSKTFVSESLLIGSAKDGKAAIIEKSPDRIALFETEEEQILCTNHYQSDLFRNDKRNVENIATSDSPYRMARLKELIKESSPVTPEKAVAILRNSKGLGGKDIGLSNEKAINQYIAHHAVIFQPEKLRMWVSTDPWQCGKFVAYDLDGPCDSLAIATDPFLYNGQYEKLIDYRTGVKKIREHLHSKKQLPEEEINRFLSTNPEMYYTWELAGDYYHTFGEKEKAHTHWQKALTKEIATQPERDTILKKLTR